MLKPMAGTVSIRRSMLVNLVLVIAVLSAGILATTVLAGHRAVRVLSASLISQSIHEAETKLDLFFGPVDDALRVTRSWGQQGMIDLDRPEFLNTLLSPLMIENPQVTSIVIADARGREHMLTRHEEGWSCRQSRPGQWGGQARWTEWGEGQVEPVVEFRDLEYDPRTRPWFTGAVELARARDATPEPGAAPPVHWTEPYTFHSSQQPGMTASITDEVPADVGNEHVIGFDVLLRDLSEFTYGLRPSKEGFAFVITEFGKLIGVPRRSLFANAEARAQAVLQQPSELPIPVVQDGTAAYFRLAEDQRESYRFVSGGRPWWAGTALYRLGPGVTLLAVIAVPESDLLGHLAGMRLWMIVLTAIVLAGGVWRVVVIARRYSRPIEALVGQSERISKGDLDPPPPIESRVTEVRVLAEAHERMRLGLRELLRLERDLQLARQIQERTFPSRLPELPGFQLDAWSEPAEATGGDTFDVVGCKDASAGGPIVLTTGRADRAFLLMADATGHGIGPALSVTQIRAMLRMAVRANQPLRSMVRHLNEQLVADLPEGRFITAWLAELDAASRLLTSFSAGQAPILRYDAARNVCDILPADTLPFGVVANLDVEVAQPIRVNAGDIIAVISDGIFEAVDASGAQFGDDRVVEAIKTNRTSSPSEIIEAIRKAVNAFTDGAPATDDRTGIVIKGL